MRWAALLSLLALATRAAEPAQRIASFSPAATRILVDLGAADRIVAVTRWCEMPDGHAADRSCDAFEPDLERLRSTGANLAILPRLANPMLLNRVQSIGIRTVLLAPESPESPAADITSLAKATDLEAAGRRLLKDRTAAARPPGDRRVLVVWDGVCAGPDSYLAWAIRAAGATPAYAGGKWPEWDVEQVGRANPDIVILLRQAGPDQARVDEEVLSLWRKTPGLRATPASKNGRIYQLKAGSNWLPASGLPSAADTIAELLAK